MEKILPCRRASTTMESSPNLGMTTLPDRVRPPSMKNSSALPSRRFSVMYDRMIAWYMFAWGPVVSPRRLMKKAPRPRKSWPKKVMFRLSPAATSGGLMLFM